MDWLLTISQVCETGLAFHNFTMRILHHQLRVSLTLDPHELCSRKAVEAFCRYVDSDPSSGLWYENQPTSSWCLFANSQQSKCTEKLVIFMSGNGWNTQLTEFDIVEEGDVPLLMSFP
jgi:hypothetical protein